MVKTCWHNSLLGIRPRPNIKFKVIYIERRTRWLKRGPQNSPPPPQKRTQVQVHSCICGDQQWENPRTQRPGQEHGRETRLQLLPPEMAPQTTAQWLAILATGRLRNTHRLATRLDKQPEICSGLALERRSHLPRPQWAVARSHLEKGARVRPQAALRDGNA